MGPAETRRASSMSIGSNRNTSGVVVRKKNLAKRLYFLEQSIPFVYKPHIVQIDRADCVLYSGKRYKKGRRMVA